MELMVWAGDKKCAELLPAPFHGYANRHSTGCQAFIAAKDDHGPRVEVWRDSKWFSHIYEFNENGKVRGVQPGCEWARPVVDAFYATLKSMHAEHKATRTREQEAARAKQEEEKAAAIARYANAAKSATTHQCPGIEIEPGVWSGCAPRDDGKNDCPTCG